MTINQFLNQSTNQLSKAGIATARLDTELLLSFILNQPREWLLAHDDYQLSAIELARLNTVIKRRLQHEPVAYITGCKEFYGRNFIVTPNVLIPRPETEQMIEILKSLPLVKGGRWNSTEFQSVGLPDKYSQLTKLKSPAAHQLPAPLASASHSPRLLDLGTGSGCLAITAKLELPQLEVTAADISPAALAIAQQNATKLRANIKFVQSDLLNNLQGREFDFILANLPYVDKSWPDLSPELVSEPGLALYANDGGLSLIKKLIIQSPDHLTDGGYLILEADRRQIPAIATFAKQHNFKTVTQKPFAIVLQIMNK